jgi:predicted membrane metal-binding protein
MTKTQRNIIVIAILIVSASLFWFIWANRKRKSSIANIQTSDVQVENGVIVENPTELDLTKLLKIGSQGEEVKELQRLINQRLDTSAYTLIR